MSNKKLHEHSRGVVHRTKHRTRLRVPKKYRKQAELHQLKTNIEQIPGVQSVEVNDQTGSVLIHHEETEGLFEQIGEALQESAPELLSLMLLPGGEEAEVGMEVLANLFKTVFVEPLNGHSQEASSHADAHASGMGAPSVKWKRMVPLAFIAAGTWKLLQEEALLAGVAPLVLFYYGFDTYWKFKQESLTAKVAKTTDSLPTEQQLAKDLAKPAKDNS